MTFCVAIHEANWLPVIGSLAPEKADSTVVSEKSVGTPAMWSRSWPTVMAEKFGSTGGPPLGAFRFKMLSSVSDSVNLPSWSSWWIRMAVIVLLQLAWRNGVVGWAVGYPGSA